MKLNLISSLILLAGSVKGCKYLTFEKGWISAGISTVNLQDGGHRFYKKFSGRSEIYAAINSEYPDGEECIAFNANIIDQSSHIGIYNYANKERTVTSDASIYYYPVGNKAYSNLVGAGTNKITILEKPVEVKEQYEYLIYRINRNTGTIGLY